ncbi:hypothetical protein DUNSADRAFT_1269 [Dunaliella salina]|uniref:UBX domain-containing protein 11 n=1 Tax=Dunaliella salina TaxID=3046 RepID=A0ABQ7GXB0_DUNSA|nr:hypothetical protein DUNSADRAFT_1269 [Dunaliella salina]|eukprot:KAF5839235.1 hypothetical protein DUNSADRAFT_1269 [Dunaliella salina]
MAQDRPMYRPGGIPPKKGGLAPMHVEDVMQRNALAGLRKDPPSGGVPAFQRASGGAHLKEDKGRPGIDDGDLIASMAKRLSTLEKNLRECTTQLSRSYSENESLKSKLRVAEEEIARHALSAVDGPVPPADGPALQHLRAENSRLRGQERHAWRQVAEMKQFLAEYGMIWVGDQHGHHQGTDEVSPRASASNLPPKPAVPNPRMARYSDGFPSAPASAPPKANASHASPLQEEASGFGRGGAAAGARARHSVSSSLDAGEGKAAGVRSRGTSWSAGHAADTEARDSHSVSKSRDAGSHAYGILNGGGELWSQPPHPKSAAAAAPLSVHASMQTPPEEEDLQELAEAAAAGAAASAACQVRKDLKRRSSSSGGSRSSIQQLLHDRQHVERSGSARGGSTAAAAAAAAAAAGVHQHADGEYAGGTSSSRQGGGDEDGGHGSSSTHGGRSRGGSIHGGMSQGGGGWRQHQGQARDGGGPWASAGLPFKLSDLLARVAELNQLAGDGCGQVVPGSGLPLGRVLQTPEPVRCTIFEDGLQLHRGPPRPFSDPVVESILRDMLDGFFPGPLKKEFPEGVPIKVIDRTRETYKSALAPISPHAYGHSNGSGGGGGRGPGSNVRSFHDLEAEESAPLPRDKFLAKLPVSVIKNGKVVDVRGGIGGLMKGAGQGGAESGKVALVPSPADALLSTTQRNHVGPVLPPPSREVSAAKLHAPNGAPIGSSSGSNDVSASKPEITTLQVKSEDGQQKMIVRLNYDDTIGTLHKCINQHRSKQQGPTGTKTGAYEVRTAFPAKAYSDLSETLRSAGLVPNATVFLRAL